MLTLELSVTAFPFGCLNYRGPHDRLCLAAIWLEVGCIEEGYLYPTNMTDKTIRHLSTLNLR